jgi:hypothetical protein
MRMLDEDSPASAGNGLATQNGGEVGRKDDLVIGDDGGLVLRGGLGEEAGHAADGLDDHVSAQEGASFGERGVFGAECVGDGEAESAATGGVAAETDRGCLQGQVEGVLADDAEHGFDEDVGELPWGEARGLCGEELPLGFDGEAVLLDEREDDGVLVGEVVVEATDRGVASSGDGSDGGGFIANLGEEVAGDVEDGGERALGALLLRGPTDGFGGRGLFRI